MLTLKRLYKSHTFIHIVLYITGPGLAIRVICAEEPYMEKDFAETMIILRIICDYSNAVKKVSTLKPGQLNFFVHELQ